MALLYFSVFLFPHLINTDELLEHGAEQPGVFPLKGWDPWFRSSHWIFRPSDDLCWFQVLCPDQSLIKLEFCVAFLKLLYVLSLELIFSAWLNCWALISYQVRLSCSASEVLVPILVGTRTKMWGIGGCPFRLLVLLSGKEYLSSLLCRHEVSCMAQL